MHSSERKKISQALSVRVMQNSQDKTCEMLCRRQGTRGYSSGWKIQIQAKNGWMKPSHNI
jgi:hypothetical protein